MSEEFPFKIEVKPSPKDKPRGDRAMAGVLGAIAVFALILLVKSAIGNRKVEEQQREFRKQGEQAAQILNDEIRKTSPDKLDKNLKILLGIKDDKAPQAREVSSDDRPDNGPAGNP